MYAWEKPLDGREYNIYKRCRLSYCEMIRTGDRIEECKKCRIRILIEQSQQTRKEVRTNAKEVTEISDTR